MKRAPGPPAPPDEGMLNPPQLIKRIGEEKVHEPKGKRVIKPEVATQVREMLEGVLEAGGTASAVSVPGYTLAGKTRAAPGGEEGGHSGTKKVRPFIRLRPPQPPP